MAVPNHSNYHFSQESSLFGGHHVCTKLSTTLFKVHTSPLLMGDSLCPTAALSCGTINRHQPSSTNYIDHLACFTHSQLLTTPMKEPLYPGEPCMTMGMPIWPLRCVVVAASMPQSPQLVQRWGNPVLKEHGLYPLFYNIPAPRSPRNKDRSLEDGGCEQAQQLGKWDKSCLEYLQIHDTSKAKGTQPARK